MKETKMENIETTVAATPVAAPAEKKARKTPATRAGTKPAKAKKGSGKAKAKSPKAGQVVKTAKPRSKDAKRIKRIGRKDHKVDLTKYTAVVSAGGNSSLDNGDEVAKTLRGKTLDEVYAIVAKATGQTQKELHALYDHLNPGMQRMNLGNKYRGTLNVDEDEE
jgi:hypothetical protein